MKKSLSTVLALVLALVLSIGCAGFAAAEETAAPAGPVPPGTELRTADDFKTDEDYADDADFLN